VWLEDRSELGLIQGGEGGEGGAQGKLPPTPMNFTPKTSKKTSTPLIYSRTESHAHCTRLY
jgi:hypothetical protein